MRRSIVDFSLFCLLAIASLFVTGTAAGAQVSEQIYTSGGFFEGITEPQIRFTVHNNTSVSISSFAISNSGAIGAGVQHSGSPTWFGSAIYRAGDDWFTLSSNIIVPELHNLLLGATNAFYFSTGNTGLGSEYPYDPLLPGSTLGSFWGVTTTGIQSQFVTIGKNALGETIVSYGETAVVPLPAAALLFLSGLGGLGMFRWRNRQT